MRTTLNDAGQADAKAVSQSGSGAAEPNPARATAGAQRIRIDAGQPDAGAAAAGVTPPGSPTPPPLAATGTTPPGLRWQAVSDLGVEVPREDLATAVAADAKGNVYLAGTVTLGAAASDSNGVSWSLRKLGPDGVELSAGWNKVESAAEVPATAGDLHAVGPALIATAANGDLVFAASTSAGAATASLVLKVFHDDGSEAVASRPSLGSDALQYAEATVLAVDMDHNLYVGGNARATPGDGGRQLGWLKKFGPDGKELTAGWDKRFKDDPAAPRGIDLEALATDNAGRVFVAYAEESAALDPRQDWVIQRLSPAGDVTWTSRLARGPNAGDAGGVPRSLRIASDGSFVVGGSFQAEAVAGASPQPRLVRFTPDGAGGYATAWDEILDLGPFGPVTTYAVYERGSVTGLAIDAHGSIYAAGYTTRMTDGVDINHRKAWLRKLSAAGQVTPGWGAVLSPLGVLAAGSSSANRTAVAVAGDAVYAAGSGENLVTAHSGNDQALVKVGADAAPQWTKLYSSKWLDDDFAVDALPNGKGSVFVLGGGLAGPQIGSLGYLRRLDVSGAAATPAWTVALSGDATFTKDMRGGTAAGHLLLDSGGNPVVLEPVADCVNRVNGACANSVRLRKFSAATGVPAAAFAAPLIPLKGGEALGSFRTDAADNLYLAGITYPAPPATAAAAVWIRKFSPNGVEVVGGGWPRPLTPTLAPTYPLLLVIDGAGAFYTAVFGDDGYELDKWSPLGASLWHAAGAFGPNGPRKSRGNRDLGVDATGRVRLMFVLNAPPADAASADTSNLHVRTFLPDGTAAAGAPADLLVPLGTWGYWSVWTPALCVAPNGDFAVSSGQAIAMGLAPPAPSWRLYSFAAAATEVPTATSLPGPPNAQVQSMRCAADGTLVFGGSGADLVTPTSQADTVVLSIGR